MPAKKTYHHGDLKNALIRAGVEILAEQGVGGLSLRQVALRAGVSHAAPYAHFADKQSLIAAISTDGFQRLYEKLADAANANRADPRQQLLETANAYLEFAADDPARFKVMFSGILEQEKDYPEFVEASQTNYELVVEIVQTCQAAGVLPPGPAERTAISIWATVHGLAALALERQIPHTLLEQVSMRELLLHSLETLFVS
ncbi:MAG TPA: TetR family transcriptional regulator [Anaerolineae bacterium]|jgi:AcrR family transcriptional regulator|nr:TetR family transcriptional regulator [Anaerolineae bacterium]